MPFPSSETISCPSASCMPRFLHVILMRVHLLRFRLLHPHLLRINLFLFRLPHAHTSRSISCAPLPAGSHIVLQRKQSACRRPPMVFLFFPFAVFPSLSSPFNFFHFFRLYPFHDTRNLSRKASLLLIAKPPFPESGSFSF